MRITMIFKKLAVFLPIIMAFLFPASAYAKGNDTYIPQSAIDACEKYGEEYGICPELLMAIAEAESRGTIDAENGNCKGIMQVSAKWHKDRMKRLGVTDIFDVDSNIHVATDYLSDLFEEYEDIGTVMLMYNGDSRVDAYQAGTADMSAYAGKILERSEELERLHGK